MAFVQVGGDESTQPTFFEVVAADKLVPSLRAAIVYALSVLSQRRPWIHRVLEYEDEVLAASMLAIDWHSLSSSDATFAESLYGLCRKKKGPKGGLERLDSRQRMLAVALQVVLPYLRTKADRLYKLHAGQSILGLAFQRQAFLRQQGPSSNWRTRLRSLALPAFIRAYPYLHAAMELATFSWQLAYLLGLARAHRPTLQLLGQQMCRVSATDMSQGEAAKAAARAAALAATRARPGVVGALQRGVLRGTSLIADNARNALIMAVFGYKALEWWFTSAETRLAASSSLAPPPPPPPLQPSPEGVGLPEDPAQCPVCRHRCVNAAQMATSGYVFCYQCVFSYVMQNGKCPVTQQPSRIEHIRKLYDTI